MHDVLSDSLICLAKSGLCLVKTRRETYSAPSRNPARDVDFRTTGNSNIYAVQLWIGERGKKTTHTTEANNQTNPHNSGKKWHLLLRQQFFFFCMGGKKKKILMMIFHGYLTCCIITSLSGLTSFSWAAELPKWGSFSYRCKELLQEGFRPSVQHETLYRGCIFL